MSDLAKRIRAIAMVASSRGLPSPELLRAWADEIDAMQDKRRDQFAAAALTGLLANPNYSVEGTGGRAGAGRRMANALIAELDK